MRLKDVFHIFEVGMFTRAWDDQDPEIRCKPPLALATLEGKPGCWVKGVGHCGEVEGGTYKPTLPNNPFATRDQDFNIDKQWVTIS